MPLQTKQQGLTVCNGPDYPDHAYTALTQKEVKVRQMGRGPHRILNRVHWALQRVQRRQCTWRHRAKHQQPASHSLATSSNPGCQPLFVTRLLHPPCPACHSG